MSRLHDVLFDNMVAQTTGLIERFVAIFVGIILVPIVFTQATAANVTGLTATILAFVPAFFALVILYDTIKGLL